MPGVGLTASYFRTWYGNFSVNDNLAVTPADFDPYCIAIPTDPRLPNGGGRQLCGLYNVTTAKFGLTDILVKPASDFGSYTQTYNGVDAILNARFGQGGFVTGGFSKGRTVTDSCFVVDSPQGSGGAAIPALIEPNAVRDRRQSQLDLRMGKVVKVSRLRLAPNLDVFNVFNANNVLAQNGSYSAAWRTPSGIVGGRLVKFSVVVEF